MSLHRPLTAWHIAIRFVLIVILINPSRSEEDGPSLQETLTWINATLRDNDPNVLYDEVIVGNAVIHGYMRNFRVSLRDTGDLQVDCNFVSVGNSPRLNSSQPNWDSVDRFRTYQLDDLQIVDFRKTRYAANTPKIRGMVIALRTSKGFVSVLHLPKKESLHPRLLKALRRLLEISKTKFKEPF